MEYLGRDELTYENFVYETRSCGLTQLEVKARAVEELKALITVVFLLFVIKGILAVGSQSL